MSDTGASSEVGGYSNSTTPSNRLQGPANDSTTTSGNAGQISTLVGGLTKAWGVYAAGKYNKKVADFNAEYARIQARQTMQAAQVQEADREMKERYIEGGTRSNFASQGVVVGAGTSRAVMQAEATVSAADKLRIETNARRAAYGFTVTAQDQEARGKFSELTGETGAVATLLSTGSQEMIESDSAYSGARSSRGIGM